VKNCLILMYLGVVEETGFMIVAVW